MKKYALWISIGSLLLLTASFFVRNAAQIPVAAWVLCPRCARANDGVKGLLEKNSLKPGDTGFNALADFVVDNLTPRHPIDDLGRPAAVEGFEYSGAIGWGATGPPTIGQITIRFSTGHTLGCSQKFLEEMVKHVFDSRLLLVSSILFGLGLLEGVYGLVLKYSPTNPPNQAMQRASELFRSR